MTGDKTLLFFPTAGCRSSGNTWMIPVHGWVYRKTELSRLRHMGLRVARRYVEMWYGAAAEGLQLFTERFGSFLADNERNERVTIHVAGQEVMLKKSRPDGHVRDAVSLELPGWEDGWLTFSAKFRGSNLPIGGKSLLLGKGGISVISDIDDTIKLSNVLRKRELLRNTFGRPFACVPGMAALYQRWATELGAAFHYVSASPWHLYPFLEEFLRAHGFPEGTWHLRDFRLVGRGLARAFRSARSVKRKHVEALLACYPERQFILVGDSGEGDAEMYGQVARECPKQVRSIYIRNVTGEDVDSPRWRKVFEGVDRDVWHVFSEACDVGIS